MSEQHLPKNLPSLYSLTAIGVATFLGSLLAGGYMLASNYIALGQRRSGMYIIYGSCACLILFVIVSAQFPQNMSAIIIMTTIQVILALAVANKLQGAMFTSFEAMGGGYHPMWRAVIIGLIASFFALFVLVLLIALFGIEYGPQALPPMPADQ